jgi:hypothetical protein
MNRYSLIAILIPTVALATEINIDSKTANSKPERILANTSKQTTYFKVATSTDYDKESLVEMNKNLPTMISPETMLTSVSRSGKIIIYHIKTPNYPASALDKQFLRDVQIVIGDRLCRNNDVRESFKRGKQMQYIISGSENKEVASFLYSQVYCEAIS